MIKKLTSIALILVMLFLAITPAYATPPPNPDIESGTAAAGGNYFQYLSSDGCIKFKIKMQDLSEIKMSFLFSLL